MKDKAATFVKPVELKRRPGQPRKLFADEATLKQIQGLGRLRCNATEVAAFFKVSRQTWFKFSKKNPIAGEMLADGHAEFAIGLRRKQLRLADTNAGMAIFLGKNYLEQSDRQELTGKDGGAIEVRTLADFYGGYVAKPKIDDDSSDSGDRS